MLYLEYFLKDFGQNVLTFLLIFTRWITITISSPLFLGQLLPGSIKISLSALLSLITLFFINEKSLDNLGIIYIFFLFLKESFLGFLIGFLSCRIFFIYEIAGQYMDFFRGASIQSQLVPGISQSSSILGQFMFLCSLTIFFSLGLHRIAILGIFQSFYDFSIYKFLINENINSLILNIVFGITNIFKASIILAMPILVICLIIDIGFSFINRMVPGFNAFFMALPLKVFLGLLVLLFSLSFIFKELFSIFNKFKLDLWILK